MEVRVWIAVDEFIRAFFPARRCVRREHICRQIQFLGSSFFDNIAIYRRLYDARIIHEMVVLCHGKRLRIGITVARLSGDQFFVVQIEVGIFRAEYERRGEPFSDGTNLCGQGVGTDLRKDIRM